MKYLSLRLLFTGAFLFSLTPASWGQNSRTFNYFDELSASGKLEVELIASSVNKIVIEGDYSTSQQVKSKLKKTHLKLSQKGNKWNEQGLKIKVYYTELRGVSANEGATVHWSHSFKGDKLVVRLSRGGKIKGSVSLKKLDLSVNQGGTISISGYSQTQIININTGGKTAQFNLNSQSTYVSITGGGEAQVRASDLLDLKINAGGKIIYKGECKQIKQSVTLGGSIQKIE